MPKWILVLNRYSGILACALAGGAVGMMYLPILIPMESVQRVTGVVGWRVGYWGALWLLVLSGATVGLVVALAYDAIFKPHAPVDPHAPITKLLGGIGRNFPDLSVGMRNLEHHWVDGLQIAVAEATIARGQFDSGSSSSTQTVAYYEERGSRLPRFGVAPKGLLMKMAGAMGLPNLAFPDQPEFSEKYLVLAIEPLGARSLLAPQVRAWLLAHPGLHMESGGTGVLVYPPGKVLLGEELASFTRDAGELLRLVDQRRRAMAQDPVQPTSIDEARAFAAQLPRSVQRSFEKQLKAQTVTRQQAEDFVRQASPRKIPSNIAYRFLRGALGMMGIGATFVGVCVVVIVLSRGQRQDWGGIIFMSLFLSAGVLMMLFSGRFWWRQRRLLRGGALAVARIRTVESTGATDENDDEVFRMSAHFQAAGQAHVGKGKVRGAVARYARNLAADAKVAAILYDVADPGRIVLVDSLVYPPDR
jgi:hypothetical protein